MSGPLPHHHNSVFCPSCGRVVTLYLEAPRKLVIHTHRIPRHPDFWRRKQPDLCTHSLMPVKLKG